MRLMEMREVPDLTLMIDETGRLWEFLRSEPVRSFQSKTMLTTAGIEISLTVPQIEAERAHVGVTNGVLSVRDGAEGAVVCQIMLPRHVHHAGVTATGLAEALQIHVPWHAPVETQNDESVARVNAA